MSNQEILEKAIKKAIDGGWKFPFGANTYEIHKYIKAQPESIAFGLREGWQDDDDPGHLEGHWSIQELIFNHDFAKALWGEKHSAHEGQFVDGAHGMRWIPDWQYHLQQMVIADDPIKYLGDHLNG